MARLLFLVALLIAACGCNRHDAEVISRIGRKVAGHAKASAGEVGGKIDLSWAGSLREPSLQEKIHDRLRYENTLTDIAFDVRVKDKEVELKGTVNTPSQRQRAIELAETVAGVERVIDSLIAKDADDQAK